MEKSLKKIKIGRRYYYGNCVKLSTRQAILIRDAFICTYCKESILNDSYHIDHIIPLSSSGHDNYTNKTLSCAKCNLKKGVQSSKKFFGREFVRRGYSTVDGLIALIKNQKLRDKFIKIYPDYGDEIYELVDYF